MRSSVLLLLMLSLTSRLAAADPLQRSVVLPSADLTLGMLLAPIADELGWPGDQLHMLTLPVDARILDSAAVAFALQHTADGSVSIQRHNDNVVLTIDRLHFRRTRQASRQALRRLVERFAPEQAQQALASWGLFLATDDGFVRMPEHLAPEHLVILVHGLDEPGHCWQTTIPTLRNAGLSVAEFRYANDQAVEASAQALDAALLAARNAGTISIDLVGHSLGGLVIRSVLANAQGYADQGAGGGRRPLVRHLITVGTPHAGSPLAAFQFASEVRDQLGHALSGNGLLFGAFLDGVGEAQFDLQPGSVFLDELATHPLPRDVRITTIAGDRSPVTADKATATTAWIRDHASSLAPSLNAIDAGLTALADGHGDGAVSLESAQWPGVVDHVIVHANHTAMLQPELPGDPEIPPAVPVILERLSAP